MKTVLYLNAFGPKEKLPNAGIFITKRIQCLRKNGIQVLSAACFMEYPGMIKWWLKKKGIPDYGKPIQYQQDVCYDIVQIKFNIFDAVLGRFFPSFYKKVIYQKMNQYLQNKVIDLIHLHGLWPFGLGLVELKKEKSIPYVVTCHGSEINVAMKDKWIHNSLLKILEYADKVEFVSNDLLSQAKLLGYSGKNGEIVFNGIDPEVFYGKKYKKNKVIGFVGNLIPIKGADRLPVIFSKIFELCGKDVEFVIIGEGALKEQLMNKMKSLPVRFTGQISSEELAEEYRKMQVLVVPSRNEGFSCAIIEAQACGVIPIAANVGGIPEALGKYGSLIEEKEDDTVCIKLAEEASNYVLGKKQVNIDQMMEESSKNHWNNVQKSSIRIYRSIT